MCCSVTPHQPVTFSQTVLYAAEVRHPDGRDVHVLGYQNHVGRRRQRRLWETLAGWFGTTAPTGNAMLLPIPARAGSLTSKNVVDTSRHADILDRYERAVMPPAPVAASVSRGNAPRAPRVEIFEAAGIYTVVLADAARAIPGVLDQVPIEKRPALNPALFDAYERWYPGWTFALCCFNNDDAAKALPLVWWYEPLDATRLFLPALDGHTGDVPVPGAPVVVDHTVAVGSHRMAAGSAPHVGQVHVGDLDDKTAPFFVRDVVGGKQVGLMPNGDFVLPMDEVRQGRFTPHRLPPPGH